MKRVSYYIDNLEFTPEETKILIYKLNKKNNPRRQITRYFKKRNVRKTPDKIKKEWFTRAFESITEGVEFSTITLNECLKILLNTFPDNPNDIWVKENMSTSECCSNKCMYKGKRSLRTFYEYSNVSVFDNKLIRCDKCLVTRKDIAITVVVEFYNKINKNIDYFF